MSGKIVITNTSNPGLLNQFTYRVECCKKIRITSSFQRDSKRQPETDIFVLQQEYPRMYENPTGDRMTRNGGICGDKENLGYWTVG